MEKLIKMETQHKSYLHIKWDSLEKNYANTNGQEFDPAVLEAASGLLKITSKYCFILPEIILGSSSEASKKTDSDRVASARMIFTNLLRKRFPYLPDEALGCFLCGTRSDAQYYRKMHRKISGMETGSGNSYRGLHYRIERDFNHEIQPQIIIPAPITTKKPNVSVSGLLAKTNTRVSLEISIGEALPYIYEYIYKEIGVSEIDLKSSVRGRRLVDGRKIFFALVAHFFRLSLKRMGDLLNRDHATVMHSMKKHADLIETSSEYRQNYNSIFDNLSSLFSNKTTGTILQPMSVSDVEKLLELKNISPNIIKEISLYFSSEALLRAKFPPNEVKRICKNFNVEI